MNQGKTLLSQIMDFVPWTSFQRIVDRHGGDKDVRTMPCTAQFRAMAFAQMTWRESLRDIEVCLNARPEKLYHMGFRSPVHRSTLTDADEARDWRIYAGLGMTLIGMARRLYADEPFGLDLEEAVYALDSTTIDLCLADYPWARFRQAKSAVKMHTLLDLRGNIPASIAISERKMHDVNALDLIEIQSGAVYVMDRAYVDFRRLNTIHEAGAFFVTRAKSNTLFHRLYSSEVDRSSGVVADQTIRLDGARAHASYPHNMRRINFRDKEKNRNLIFITNQLSFPAITICEVYKNRWQVELFFKWMKQHLRIKRFYGQSENAVKTQLWIAVSVYVLLAIASKTLNLNVSLHTLVQVISVHAFEKHQIKSMFLQKQDRV